MQSTKIQGSVSPPGQQGWAFNNSQQTVCLYRLLQLFACWVSSWPIFSFDSILAGRSHEQLDDRRNWSGKALSYWRGRSFFYVNVRIRIRWTRTTEDPWPGRHHSILDYSANEPFASRCGSSILKSFKHWVDVGIRVTVLMRCADVYQIGIWPAQPLLGYGVVTSVMTRACLQFTAYFVFFRSKFLF